MEPREYQRQWRKKNPEKHAEQQRRHRRKHPEIHAEQQRKYKRRHPEVVRAHRVADNLPLGSCCIFCGAKENLERHHPDYGSPDFYITVCERCHKELNKLGRE